MDSRQDFDQGGLPGSVLPEESVDLTGEKSEVDVRQSPYAGELLDDARHFQDGPRLCHGSAPRWDGCDAGQGPPHRGTLMDGCQYLRFGSAAAAWSAV